MIARYRIYQDPGDETIAFVQLMRALRNGTISATVAHVSGEVFTCEFSDGLREDAIVLDLLSGMGIASEEIGSRVKYMRLEESAATKLNEPTKAAQPTTYTFKLAQGDNMKEVTDRMNEFGKQGYDCTQLVSVGTGGWVALMRKENG